MTWTTDDEILNGIVDFVEEEEWFRCRDFLVSRGYDEREIERAIEKLRARVGRSG